MKIIVCHRDPSKVKIVADVVNKILQKQHLGAYGRVSVSMYSDVSCQWLSKKLDEDPYCFDIFLFDAYDPAFVALADRVRSCNVRASIIFLTDHFDTERMNRDMFRFRPTALIVDINRCEHITEALEYCCEEQRLACPFMTLKINRQERDIPLRDILYIENDGHSSIIATVTEDMRVNKPLSQLIQLLPKDMFLRCHVSYCVNMARIRSYRKEYASFVMDVRLRSIPISRQYLRAVFDHYRNYLKNVRLG